MKQPFHFGWLLAVLVALSPAAAAAQSSLAGVVAEVQPKIAKIYGAGGTRGLEHYQSGMLISAEGHVLTVWSYVLDSDEVIVMLNDGRRFVAKLVGADPRLEIAVLKIEAAEVPHFNLPQAATMDGGTKVLAFSNLFNVATGEEAASVQQGVIAATANLSARRGVYQTPYRGSVYILDAVTNNPGAAGGVLTDRRGNLAGMLGKELRSSLDNTWLNYAVPIAELRQSVDDILSGKARPRSKPEEIRRPAEPMTLELLGIVLLPDVLPKTPPFVDHVRAGSPAAKAGLRPDDLIVFLNDQTINSGQILRDELGLIDRIDEVRLVLLRGQELINVSLFADR
jgi:S1-C subfamily serine protease